MYLLIITILAVIVDVVIVASLVRGSLIVPIKNVTTSTE